MLYGERANDDEGQQGLVSNDFRFWGNFGLGTNKCIQGIVAPQGPLTRGLEDVFIRILTNKLGALFGFLSAPVDHAKETISYILSDWLTSLFPCTTTNDTTAPSRF